MNDYVIVTDACCDLSQSLIKETKVEILPLIYHAKGETFYYSLQNKEREIKDFYKTMRDGEMPSTSQLNPVDAVECFRPYLRSGKDVLYIAFSSGLSGTYQSGKLAAIELQEEFPDRKMIVIDSLAASMGEGLLVWYASQKKASGMTIDEVATWVENNRQHICHWFTVDDLHHLKRGGRVSAASAVIGSALSIKPILHVDDEGHLIPVKKVRGRKQSLDVLADMVTKTAIEPSEQTIFISHGDSLEDAKYLEKKIKEKHNTKNIQINYIGPVIGTHSGPGTIALFYFGSEK